MDNDNLDPEDRANMQCAARLAALAEGAANEAAAPKKADKTDGATGAANPS